MTPLQKNALASRRVTVRHAIVDAIQSALTGLPVSIVESGSIRLGDEVSDSQFDSIARTISDLASQSSVVLNFAKGDLWNLAIKRYGGGRRLIERLYSNEDVIDRHCSAWAQCAVVARRVAEHLRDTGENKGQLWTYYRENFGKKDHARTVSSISACNKRNVKTVVDEYVTIVTWEELSGRPRKEEFPSIPIRKAVQTFMDKLDPEW